MSKTMGVIPLPLDEVMQLAVGARVVKVIGAEEPESLYPAVFLLLDNGTVLECGSCGSGGVRVLDRGVAADERWIDFVEQA